MAAISANESLVWNYFERSMRDGVEISKCRINGCGCELSGHRATNAKRHLKAVHDIDEVDVLDKERQLAKPTTTAALNG